ncbi:uncharacterized protein C18orf63-like isoform X2 [Nylanderia fulva]|uniref:uncharacterized protein C18orf63-like isoform X2 n=1 Tax=Nylanderia fulva TaxID=613905 RepID=UPI0010FB4259|nr:uncharacterized protein C18orf63-like isoform X2 [Nylanderia fulva]
MVSTVKIFNITIPEKSSLCCAICKIINFERKLIYSKHCAKILKCREFLQKTPQAMAAPINNRKILESGGSIYVIVTREFFESCDFQNHCDTLNIQMIDLLEPIPTYVYKTCLLYTLEYKIAPQWNKVGSYLVEGQDFLNSTGNVDAIMLNIKEIRDNNAQLFMEAVNLRIPFVKLNRKHSIQNNFQPPVRVLPSMKVANVLRVSKTIKSLFKDYEDLRAYWKNMHGYILPDYEDGILFYNIEFFYFKSNIFLYPEMCLTSGPLEILPSMTDPQSRIYKFIADLRRKVTKICEQQLNICPKNTFQTAVLTPCSPVLPRVRLPAYDTGYGTQSRRLRSVMPSLRVPDTCDIPAKRSRLSLSKTDDSLTCATEINDFDLGIKTCLSNKLNRVKTEDSISTILCDVDNISKPIVRKDENESCYFKTEEQKSENKFFMELTNKEEKPEKLSLKEKLLRNF